MNDNLLLYSSFLLCLIKKSIYHWIDASKPLSRGNDNSIVSSFPVISQLRAKSSHFWSNSLRDERKRDRSVIHEYSTLLWKVFVEWMQLGLCSWTTSQNSLRCGYRDGERKGKHEDLEETFATSWQKRRRLQQLISAILKNFNRPALS